MAGWAGMSGRGWPGWLTIRTALLISPASWTREIEALICRMRGSHPRWGPRRLLFELGKAKVTPAAVPVDHLPGAGPPSPGPSPEAEAPPSGL